MSIRLCVPALADSCRECRRSMLSQHMATMIPCFEMEALRISNHGSRSANLVLVPDRRSRERSGWGWRRTPCGGRPRWRPTRQQLEEVEHAARAGLAQDAIAALLGVSESTLKRHCAEQLRLGFLHCRAQVALVAFEMACTGMHPAMTRFWLRTYLGW